MVNGEWWAIRPKIIAYANYEMAKFIACRGDPCGRPNRPRGDARVAKHIDVYIRDVPSRRATARVAPTSNEIRERCVQRLHSPPYPHPPPWKKNKRTKVLPSLHSLHVFLASLEESQVNSPPTPHGQKNRLEKIVHFPLKYLIINLLLSFSSKLSFFFFFFL